MDHSTPGLPVHNSRSLPKLKSIELVMPSSCLILCRPLLLLPPIPPSIRVFSNESTLCIWWPKYWSFSFSICPSNEHPGLIYFRIAGWISWQSKGLSRVFSSTKIWKHQFFSTQLFMVQLSVQFSSVTQSCLTLCDSMNLSMPGTPVHHQLPEFTQTHVHQVGDAIQQSHPLSSPSPALNLSQHQGLFQWVSSSHQVATVLEFQLQHSVLPMNIQDWFPLGWTGWISLQSKGPSRVFSNTTVQKHQFFSAQLSL